jgi:hypothetical protein
MAKKPTADQISQIRSILNMPDLTDTAIESLVGAHGGVSGTEKWAQSHGNPAQQGFWAKGWGGLEQSIEHPGSVKIGLTGLQMDPQAQQAVSGTPAGGGGGAPAKPAETAAQRTAALTKQVASSPWTVMGDYLAQQYSQASGAAQGLINPYAGGQNSQNAQMAGAATQNALALTGMGGNAGSWLAQQQAAASAVDAPVAQAMAQEQGVYAKEAGPISQAILNYGQANALGEITAPEASWLNALATHITSNLSYYGEVPTAALPTFEANPALGTAIQQSGGYGGAGGAGLTPVASVPTLAGSSKQTNVSALAGIGAGAYGTVPTAGVGPSG